MRSTGKNTFRPLRLARGALLRLDSSTLVGQQGSKLLQNLTCGFPRQFDDELSFSNTPIEILYLVGKNDSGERRSRRNRPFERIAFDVACVRTQDRQSEFAVDCGVGLAQV